MSSQSQFTQPLVTTSVYSDRAKLRAFDEDFDWLSSYHSRCFYAKYKSNATRLESGYLKSTLLIKVCSLIFLSCTSISCFVFLQVYKSIFTSLSSAKDNLDDENTTENLPSTKSNSNTVRCNVASKLHLNNKVTPRSIAYAAVQVCIYVLYLCRFTDA